MSGASVRTRLSDSVAASRQDSSCRFVDAGRPDRSSLPWNATGLSALASRAAISGLASKRRGRKHLLEHREVRLVSESSLCELFLGKPRDRIMLFGLAVLGVPIPACDRPDRQVQAGPGTSNMEHRIVSDDADVNAELFEEFASKGFVGMFSQFHMATREVPDRRVPPSVRRAMTEKDFFTRPEYRCHDTVPFHRCSATTTVSVANQAPILPQPLRLRVPCAADADARD